MNLQELLEVANKVKNSYVRIKEKNNEPQWTSMDYTSGFVGDVGDLIKLVMAKNNLRHIDDVDEKLAYELSDCLWCVLILASEFNINLEKAFLKSINELNEKLEKL